MEATRRGTAGVVLVTGATGHLGSRVCRTLLERGYDVRATDLRYAPGLPVRVELGDLRDEHFAYRLTEGCGAVVHLGNHPNAWCGPSRQRLLAENVAMNANVFVAAVEQGVRCLVFSSSIQVVLRSAGGHGAAPYAAPYLPLDGRAPPDPGTNAYALSKEHGERLLQVLAGQHPDLCATALRFPMLPTEAWLRRAAAGVPAGLINWADFLTYLTLEDAADLIATVLERRSPGYRQYLPARTLEIPGRTLEQIVAEHYAHVPRRDPACPLMDLVDRGDLLRDLDWRPRQEVVVSLGAGEC